MLTAHTDKSFLIDAISLKLTKYLVKPVSRKDLKEAIELTINELLKYNISPIKKIDLHNNFSWDIELRELKQYNNIIELTNKERKLLELLFSHKNRIFTYDEIFDFVWDYEEISSINSLKNMVKRLRKKLPKDTILNIFNEGYKIHF
jgi:DNA-binding response OmpR family regulator